MTRPRGAQPSNQNALKHGYYRHTQPDPCSECGRPRHAQPVSQTAPRLFRVVEALVELLLPVVRK